MKNQSEELRWMVEQVEPSNLPLRQELSDRITNALNTAFTGATINDLHAVKKIIGEQIFFHPEVSVRRFEGKNIKVNAEMTLSGFESRMPHFVFNFQDTSDETVHYAFTAEELSLDDRLDLLESLEKAQEGRYV